MVGEGGIQPEYFYHRMTFNEARLFIKGMQHRYRPTYEAARMIHGCIGGLFAKDYKLPEFPWDKENQRRDTPYPTKEEYDEMMEEARRFEQRLNSKK